MRRRHFTAFCLALTAALCFAPVAFAQVKSGPQPGEYLPGSFAPYNLNGPSKGLHHSLVCEYGLRPVVMVFVRERPDGKEQAVPELLKKLDDLLDKHRAEGFEAFAVFLSPDAKSAVSEEKTEDVDQVLKEEDRREKLQARLAPLAGQFKHLVIGTYPDLGPPEYKLSPQAEVTVILYQRLKVRENWAFGPGQLDAPAVELIAAAAVKLVAPRHKKQGS
jgi:hypothetical protein